MYRIALVSFCLHLFTSVSAFAQTCDPYQPRIDVNHVTYQPPSGESAEDFFATLELGTPVAELAPYVWRHDNGWYWSCAAAAPEPEPDPQYGTVLKVGHIYFTNYTEIFRVTNTGRPHGQTTDSFVIEYLTGSCGLAWRRMDQKHKDIYRELQPEEIQGSCPVKKPLQ